MCSIYMLNTSNNSHDVKEAVEKTADHLAHPDHETDREAKKRQPWMPIAGSIIAGIILIALLFYFVF